MKNFKSQSFFVDRWGSFLLFDKEGPLAQLVEQLTLNQWVVGSNPTGPTKKTKGFQGISKTTPHFRQAYGEQNEKFRFSLSLS
jgi:hypothetical protein